MKEDQLFFVGQKAFIEKDGKLLVIFNERDKIDFPGGKIQEGEKDLRASLVREVLEETGLSIIIYDPFVVWSFALPDNHRHAGKLVFLVGYRCSIRGGELKLSDEHLRYEWVGKVEISKLDDGSGHFRALQKYFAKI
ncbi:MAG: NUDIX domain-containing protein [Minisyncoccia bacterium]|jgi:8-oxo-dGTP pyrophosphatase MutT (NUDIX family)